MSDSKIPGLTRLEYDAIKRSQFNGNDFDLSDWKELHRKLDDTLRVMKMWKDAGCIAYDAYPTLSTMLFQSPVEYDYGDPNMTLESATKYLRAKWELETKKGKKE